MFALNALTFLALIIAVASIRMPAPPKAQGSMGDVFREGVSYAWHTWLVRLPIFTLIALNLTASAYAVLLPVFARDVFAGDARTLGWLWGAAGCGAFVSHAVSGHPPIHARPGAQHHLRRGAQRAGAVGVWAHRLAAAGAGGDGGAGLWHFGEQCRHQYAAAIHRPDRLRGRVVSFFTSARFGFDALGGLLAGLLATVLGAGWTLALEGVLLLGFVLFLLSRRRALRQAIDRHDPTAH